MIGAQPANLTGWHQVTYSGGQVSWYEQIPAQGGSEPYWLGGPPGDYGGDRFQAWGGWVECSGEITATLTWNGGMLFEPAPPKVLVRETSYARYLGQTGSASNGLGHPEQNGVSQGERWVMKDGGNVVTVTCSPFARAEQMPREPWATVWYKAEAFPISLKIEGAKLIGGNLECMIGQRIRATIDPGYAFPDNTYTWTVNGGSPFTSYNVGPFGINATVTPYSQPQTGPTTQACFRRNKEAEFTCTAFIGGPIQQTVVLSKEVEPLKPLSMIGVYMGTTKLVSGGADGTIVLKDGIHQFPGWNYPQYQGIFWALNPVTPAPFNGSGGGWHIVQTVVPSRYLSTINGPRKWSINDLHGLDTVYPYDPVPGFTWPDSGEPNGSSDSPSATEVAPAVFSVTTAGESFRAYPMYLPPSNGLGSEFVPLKEISWFWNGSINWEQQSQSWTGVHGGSQGWSYTGDFPPHPEWDLVHSGSAPWIPWTP